MMPNQMGGPPMGSRAPPPMYSPHMNQGGSPAMQGMMAQSPAGGQYVQSPASQVRIFFSFLFGHSPLSDWIFGVDFYIFDISTTTTR